MIAKFNEIFHDKGKDTTLGYHIILLGKDFQHWAREKMTSLGFTLETKNK